MKRAREDDQSHRIDLSELPRLCTLYVDQQISQRRVRINEKTFDMPAFVFKSYISAYSSRLLDYPFIALADQYGIVTVVNYLTTEVLSCTNTKLTGYQCAPWDILRLGTDRIIVKCAMCAAKGIMAHVFDWRTGQFVQRLDLTTDDMLLTLGDHYLLTQGLVLWDIRTGQPINKYHASSCIFPGGYLISWKNGYLVRTDMIYMIETNMFAIPHTSKSGQVLLLKRNRLLAYSSEKSIGFTFLVIDCDNNTVIRQFDINLSASRIYIISNDIIFLQEDRLGYHSKGYGHLISITAEKVIKTISTLHNDSCMHQEADIDRINGVFIYKSLSTGGFITNHRPYQTIMAGYMLYDEYSVETEHMKTNLVTCGHFSDVSISMVT
jgi:hypothetical protein